MKRISMLIALTICVSVSAFADIARPEKGPVKAKPAASIDGTLYIKLDREAKEAKLIIPKSQVKQLRAELERIDNGGDVAAAASTGGFSRTQTIVSGMFLSLAIAFGGMLFLRSKPSTAATRSIVIGAVVVFVGVAGTFVYANVGPPPAARSITSKLFDEKVFIPYRFASGKIKIETSEDSNRVELIVPEPTATPKDGE